jgi:hypothetical protein
MVYKGIFSGTDVAHNKKYIRGDLSIDLLKYHKSNTVAAHCNNIISRGLYPIIT